MSDEHVLDLAGSGIELRPAGQDDHDLIRRIVTMTADWRAENPSPELAPDVDKYHQDWGGPGDLGVLAFRGIEFAGGAFVRRFGAADGNYGYVSDEYPELAIAVEAGFRRQGLAALLIAAIKAKVLENGGTGISLSVHPDNDAQRLYRAMGFELVEDRGDDLLMLWRR